MYVISFNFFVTCSLQSVLGFTETVTLFTSSFESFSRIIYTCQGVHDLDLSSWSVHMITYLFFTFVYFNLMLWVFVIPGVWTLSI
ncbi:hypothetical protein OIU78_027193 [Salix suchowensis]|nr:hypothetical protein OIU78_027193 [Salix suchowensis]